MTLESVQVIDSELSSLDNPRWNMIVLKGSNNSFKIENNSDGTCKLTANGEIGDRAVVTLEGYDPDRQVTRKAVIFFEIRVPSIKLSQYRMEMIYNTSNTQQNSRIINSTVDSENKIIEVRSDNEQIAKVEVIEYGQVKVTPVGPGETTISFICKNKDGIEESIRKCNINVIVPIKNIDLGITEVTLNEGEQRELSVSINEGATEQVYYTSSKSDVARVAYKDGKYILYGISEGEANITFFSGRDYTTYKNIKVTVKKQVAPKIVNCTVTKGKYKENDNIVFKFIFDKEIKIAEGKQAPKLTLKIGDKLSVNTPEFVGISEDKKTIEYKYTVGKGDNGTVMIQRVEQDCLTDSTGKLLAITTVDNNYFNQEYNYIPVDNDVVDNREVNVPRIEKGSFVNHGIYVECVGVEVDTENPIIEIENVGKKWLNNDDTIEVMVISRNDILAKAPKVLFNGVEAIVTGEGTTFKATLKVTDLLKEGYVEITVDDIEDEAGNKSNKLTTLCDNIGTYIVIDRTAPFMQLVKPNTENKTYKAGDKIKIGLRFIDKTRNQEDYISAKQAPELKLMFGDKEAKGTLTSDFKGESEYTSLITYTYTISEEDEGDFCVQSITGNVQDVAGNKLTINQTYNNEQGYILNVAKNVQDTDTPVVDKFVISYNANKGTNAPEAQTKEKGKTLKITTSEPTREGYKFIGWSTSKRATEAEYKPGADYTDDRTITLYAVWEEVKTGEDKENSDKTKTENKTQTDDEDDIDSILKLFANDNSSIGNSDESKTQEKVKSYDGSLPYTGIRTAGIMIIGVALFDIGIAMYFINKKRNM